MSGSIILIIVTALVISAVQVAVGFGVGWWMRNQQGGDSPVDTAEMERARQILAGMQNLAADVAADVGQHSARMEKISQDLAVSTDGPVGAAQQEAVNKAVNDIVAANGELKRKLREAEQRLAQQSEMLKTQEIAARTDALTGINNRRAFDTELERRFGEWFRLGIPLSLIMVDVDFFKKFNDKYGHQAGDEVLKTVARTLARTMRDIDVVARFGGEEFAVILIGTRLAEAKFAAERLRQAIESAQVEFEGQNLQVTASLGLAEVDTEDSIESLVKRADEALYAAKKAGRNRGYLHRSGECLPLLEAPATVLEGAPAALAPDDPDAEKRQFRRKQRIARYDGGPLPDPSEYREVLCQEISIEGFTFITREPIDFQSLVVALGAAPSYTFMGAELVKATPVAQEYGGGHKVECRFTERIAERLPEPRLQAAVAK